MQHTDDSRWARPWLHVSSGTGHGGDGASAEHVREQNLVLRALPLEDYAWLLPDLTRVRLRPRQVLIEPGEPIAHAWFVRHGVASIIAIDDEGDSVEVGSIGFEGFVGLPLLLDDDTLPNLVIASLHGEAWRISASDFRHALDERPALRTMCLRYAASFTTQLAQSVACNRIHTLEERCAHWLLMTHERVHHEPFALTHQFLAAMLGVRRAGVSVVMGSLRDAGIIHNTRGRITVLDRARLEAASCSCHRHVQDTLGRLLGVSAFGRAGEDTAGTLERAGSASVSNCFRAPRVGLVGRDDSLTT